MARYQNVIPTTNIDNDYVANGISQYLVGEGFSNVDYKGQKVWKKGIGFLTAPQYVAITFTPDSIVIEAFIKFALFPGVFIGELGTAGAFAIVPKQMLAGRVKAIENYLYSLLQYQTQQTAPQQPNPQVQ